jgi:hypothetical protein
MRKATRYILACSARNLALIEHVEGIEIYYVAQVWLILLRKGLAPLMMEAKRKKVYLKK